MPDPAATPAQMLRSAADVYGSEALAALFDVSPRAFYRWLDGTREPRDWPSVLATARLALIDRRHQIGDVVSAIRAWEGKDTSREDRP